MRRLTPPNDEAFPVDDLGTERRRNTLNPPLALKDTTVLKHRLRTVPVRNINYEIRKTARRLHGSGSVSISTALVQ
ncbi:unnamed protein product [Angiostrongylus costaricensis]|uniref:Transposase n=1 Tax=Angiostrongylus costaricensis TaxID=334426 RepID=A0A0R3PB64_ANGCS|nr:unnamed protein product [Angiostrongylus costaricensis]